MTAGYSGTPLPKKLGVKDGLRVVLLGEVPEGFDLGVPVQTALRGKADVVLLFTKERQVLEKRIVAIGEAIRPDGGAWVAWPKRASKVATDMTEDVVRQVVLPLGLVDTKVCAIDDIWSGLRLVWRRTHRERPGG